jgi:hypothetical protein
MSTVERWGGVVGYVSVLVPGGGSGGGGAVASIRTTVLALMGLSLGPRS